MPQPVDPRAVAARDAAASVLDAAAIANQFADGTLPSALLQALLSDDAHPGDAHIALDIIESLKS